MCQAEGVPSVICVFESLVIVSGRGIGQVELVSMLFKAVYHPVPIIGGLHFAWVQDLLDTW